MVVINNTAPAEAPAGNNGMGFLLGVVLLIVFFVGFMYYGLPMIRQSFTTPSIQVPSKVDVNVQQK